MENLPHSDSADDLAVVRREAARLRRWRLVSALFFLLAGLVLVLNAVVVTRALLEWENQFLGVVLLLLFPLGESWLIARDLYGPRRAPPSWAEEAPAEPTRPPPPSPRSLVAAWLVMLLAPVVALQLARVDTRWALGTVLGGTALAFVLQWQWRRRVRRTHRTLVELPEKLRVKDFFH